jgi:hypothetical protein
MKVVILAMLEDLLINECKKLNKKVIIHKKMLKYGKCEIILLRSNINNIVLAKIISNPTSEVLKSIYENIGKFLGYKNVFSCICKLLLQVLKVDHLYINLKLNVKVWKMVIKEFN